MKKFFLGALALVFLTVISCKDAANKAEEAADTAEEAVEEVAEKVEEAAEEVAEKVEEAVDGVPSFDNQKVQDYVNEYEAYLAEYAKIVESKDMTAFAGLAEKGTNLGKKASEIAGELTGDDAKKWTDYMTASSEKMQALAKKMTQQ
ncbi:hypothetical protein IWQ47_002685 [Aquimarina sp. EL_43]|uniref:hypothetical protein n=1 Tax=unclassified Aquimarina TaxID=2627091 RepID=UPI0018CAF89F|nr:MULTISPECIES: hypothetical protein [unclassified Aquimarina]MBG6131446.1 hypothetical protein [Aquimarina sp. EL_35]MBG6151671.1 hypothetical protein [Aquimarina sp. EL_32]MBG6169601.1 hypothetical protein [Aquimarina sp. EL_43]